MKKSLVLLSVLLLTQSCQHKTVKVETNASAPTVAGAGKSLLFSGEERHLKNIRQLTFGGQNAEAYFSADGQWLIFQSERDGHGCDQMYYMRVDGSEVHEIATGGRVTCGYFVGLDPVAPYPGSLLFSSTHETSKECPAKPDFSKGYVWPMYDSYEIYERAFAGGPLRRLTDNKAYDAESTVSPDQREVVFTSDRDGDLDLYLMNVDGSHVRRVTKDLGYDGGAFFSHDGKKLIYRAFHPQTAQEKKTYKEDLKNHLYRPTWLELFVIGTNGKGKHQITNLKGASFAPFLFPNDKRVIFASNYKNPRGREFNIYAIDLDGKNLEQITFSGTFDSFPMFSPDGKKLVWASNRNGKAPHETNIFIADWIP